MRKYDDRICKILQWMVRGGRPLASDGTQQKKYL